MNAKSKTFELYADMGVSKYFHLFKMLHCADGNIPKGTSQLDFPDNLALYMEKRLKGAEDVSVMNLDIFAAILSSGMGKIIKRTGDKKFDELSHQYEMYFNRCVLSYIHSKKKENHSIDDLEEIVGYELMLIQNRKVKTSPQFKKALEKALRERFADRLIKFGQLKKWNHKELEKHMQDLYAIDLMCNIEYLAYKQAKIRKENARPKCKTAYTKCLPMADISPATFKTTQTSKTNITVDDTNKFYALIQIDDDTFKYIRDTHQAIKNKSIHVLFQRENALTVKQFKSRIIQLSIADKDEHHIKWKKNMIYIQSNHTYTISALVNMLTVE